MSRAHPELSFCVAQLRHLYKQMLSGEVRDPEEAARYILGPVIERLEKLKERGGD